MFLESGLIFCYAVLLYKSGIPLTKKKKKKKKDLKIEKPEEKKWGK